MNLLPRLALLAVSGILLSALPVTDADALTMSEKTKRLARQEFRASARRPCVPAKPCFKVRNNYPKTLKAEEPAWAAIDYRAEPERYLQAVLDYIVEGNPAVDWQLQKNR